MSNDQLPERDPTKTNAQQGLYGKFRIERTDGSSAPGGKHHDCDYFVLDVTHDKHAKAALAAYADAAEATHPQLAADMRARWRLPVPTSDHAPIARITIGKSGAIFGPQHLYAPGLPPGEHDLWCVPVRAAAQPGNDGLAVRALEELHQLGYVVRDGLLYPPDRAQSAGDAAPDYSDAWLRARGAQAGGTLSAVHQAVSAPAGAAAMPCGHHPSLMLKSAETGADLYCELCDAQSARRDAEQREANLQADLVEERNRIASMRTEWGAEAAALTAQARHAEAEAAKSERRAIEFGDALHRNILAMRAAFVAWCRGEASDGMGWIANTLAGPGHIPGEAEVALGAQALFDKEVAEHEAFRATHPGPAAPAAAPAPRDTAAMLAEHMETVDAAMKFSGAADDFATEETYAAVEASARKLLGEAS
jgi:hypothetical protein